MVTALGTVVICEEREISIATVEVKFLDVILIRWPENTADSSLINILFI